MKKRKKEATIAKPFLKWAGSKKKLLPRLKVFWDKKYSRYVEPFGGSASLFFALRPRKALIGDNNPDLIETYKILKKYPKKVFIQINKFRKGKRSYLKIRKENKNILSEVKRAARFIYLNQNCFNGLYRTNLKGEFNVPYGASKSKIFKWDSFKEAAALLRRASFICADFEDTLKKVKKNDFVYLDPPYAVKNKRFFCEYGVESFKPNDIFRLKSALCRLDKQGTKFVLSYAFCPEIKPFMKKWYNMKVRNRRNIAGFAKNRRTCYEVFISNIPINKK